MPVPFVVAIEPGVIAVPTGAEQTNQYPMSKQQRVWQRDNSLGEHMCAFDEMGVDTDGASQTRTLGVKKERKPGGLFRWWVTLGFFLYFSCSNSFLHAEKKKKKFEQPTELVSKEGKTKAMRVTIGLFTWRKPGLYTKPWMQHSGKKITWSHVHGLEGFPLGISTHGIGICLFPCCLLGCPNAPHTIYHHHTGSMDLENFPKLAHYFCENLPDGYGKGKKAVIFILDGHSSRWDPFALNLFKENNVHVWVIASHSSVWGQVSVG